MNEKGQMHARAYHDPRTNLSPRLVPFHRIMVEALTTTPGLTSNELAVAVRASFRGARNSEIERILMVMSNTGTVVATLAPGASAKTYRLRVVDEGRPAGGGATTADGLALRVVATTTGRAAEAFDPATERSARVGLRPTDGHEEE
jgi:hypothetical protein